VYSKLKSFHLFLFMLVLGFAGVLDARPQSPAQVQASAPAVATAPPAPATLRGHVTDQTGALIPGASVTIATPDGVTVSTATADSSGAYSVAGLKPGNYVVQANFAGFAPFQSPAIALAGGQIKRVDIAMAIEVAEQSVTVTDESPTVNVEAGGNSNAIVLKGKDLEALSDDPDELSNELTALAGPSAGPNGGQIYIDGFSGGQLPPKSAIREIRINQNPFSAEYDKLGYGRIEILTKPGTDKLHGQFFLQGNDKSFNTGNPFTSTVPDYYSYQFNGTASGALSKTASFFVSAEQRNTENDNAWLIPDAVIESSGVYTDFTNYGVNLLNRRIRDNVSARIDLQLGSRNTFTARYGFWSESEHGDLNQGSLPSASTHESNTDHTVQMSDAFVINDHAVTENRFQYERQNENHYPDSTARTINVQGDFSGGGYSGQQTQDHATRLEYQNLTTISHGAHAIKLGTRMRDSRDANLTNGNFNGSFTFANAQIYENVANGLASGGQFSTLVMQNDPKQDGSISAQITSGNESTVANVFDIALFAQDDWKVNPRLTLSGGLRWEAQNHTSDHDDWAPRVAFAYALDGGDGKKAKTVVRGGYGFFYDRLGSNSLLTINRANVQNRITLYNPTCQSSALTLDTIDLNQVDPTNCTGNGPSASTTLAPDKYEVAPSYHSPNTEQLGASLERQVTPTTSATLTYLHSFGVHQLVTRNANQAIGGTPQSASGGHLYEYFPEAVFKQQQLIASVNSRLNKNLSLVGFYTLSYANTDGAGGSASNAYNLAQDYGRAGFISRNMVFAMASYTGPWGIRFNPFLIAQSGKPFNVTLPNDQLNNFGNQRPAYAPSADCTSNPNQFIATAYGCFDSQIANDEAQLPSGETLAPINLGNGPAAVSFNLRVSRGFGIGPKVDPNAPQGVQSDGAPPPGGGGGGGGRGGPGGGGPGGGGFGGFGMGGGGRGGPGGPGGPGTGRKYSLTFSAQALNLFNDIDYGQPNGNITSPNFGKSTSLAGGIFSAGSAARRIFVQATFAF
jgi:hypothetical protein